MAERICVFDSGVGGLSVLEEVRKKRPHAEYVYFCDRLNFPYGEKSESAVVQTATKYSKILCDQFKPDLLIIACNTASTVALDSIRKAVSVPVVGVVPALKPAAAFTKTGTIALLATPGTIQRKYTENLIQTFCSHLNVVRVGSSDLVKIAEEKLLGIKPDPSKIRNEIEPLIANSKLDTVVLGCTHFPLLVEELSVHFKQPIHWVDSGSAIANRVDALLGKMDGPKQQVESTAVFSGVTPIPEALERSFRSFGFSSLSYV